jgi:D-serine deaminase-like pyridoxal phosphate-dependent protein
MSNHRPIGAATKGLALRGPRTLGELREQFAATPHVIGGSLTRYPVLELRQEAVAHNIGLMAAVTGRLGVQHAPHIKTSMSPQLVQQQLSAGSWGVTTATVGHISTLLSWGLTGLDNIFHANQVVRPEDAAYLASEVHAAHVDGRELTIYVYVDSAAGVSGISQGITEFVASTGLNADAAEDVRKHLVVTVELGVPDGRTGVRSTDDAREVARCAREAGLSVRGVSGYEGSVASGQTVEDLHAVGEFVRELRSLAGLLVEEGLIDVAAGGGEIGSVIVSAGGSAYLDVVLAELAGPIALSGTGEQIPVIPVVRAGAYVIHDHGLLERANPWKRMPAQWFGDAESAQPQAAATIHAVVLSTPEPGLALLNVGRRDLPFDIDLPRILSHNGWQVTAVNDQHAFVRPAPGEEPELVQPGDIMTLGISHPCTLFDKWTHALVTDNDHRIVDIIETQF